MAEYVTKKFKRKKMSINDTQVKEGSGYVIGLGIRRGNKTSGSGAKIEVLDETCFICCGDVKCSRHSSDMILEKAGCSTAEEVSSCVISMGIKSRNISAGGGVVGGADGTQSTQAKKKTKNKSRKLIKNNITN